MSAWKEHHRMRSVDVILRRSELDPGRAAGRACAVIDVLRAGTSVARAFAECASEVRLFREVEEARAARKEFRLPAVLAGERAGLKIPGFDAGNSPRDFSKSLVGGKTIFFTTTNGTAALADCAEAAFVAFGALVNATAIATALAARGEGILVVCAGTEGNYAGEDVLCAGIIASRILSDVGPGHLSLGDGARIALAYAAEGASRPAEVLSGCAHGKVLASLGLRADLTACAAVDALDVVPVLKRDPLRLVLE
jgi:2-phosphosulfolactate phosphatase